MFLVIISMCVLLCINFYFIERKITYPPNLLTLTYIVILSVAYFVVTAFDYNHINMATLAIIYVGCFFFSIGATYYQFLIKEKVRKDNKVNIGIWPVKVALLMLILYYPVLYKEFSSYNPSSSFAIKILRIREMGLEEKVYSTLTNNMIILSGIIYLAMMYLYSHIKVSIYWLCISLSTFVAYSLLTGTRATIIFLVVSSILIYINQAKKIKKGLLISLFLSAFFVGGVIAVFMGKDGANREQGIMYNAPYVLENYFSYGIQGVFLLDNYVTDKYKITPSWDILSGTKTILNKLGMGLEMKSKHAEFSYFGNGKYGNVYTMFFSVYPYYGILGVVMFFTFFGFVSSFLYSNGSSVSAILLGYINGAIVISIFNEQVFTNLIYTIKIIIILSIFSFINKVKYEFRNNYSLV